MDTKDVLKKIRTQNGLTQDEMAGKLAVTRQAVSRWETGETVPNTETLKLLSRLFDVSINTLLGSPRQLICQCCGMPLDAPEDMGSNADGSPNRDYCRWCYQRGAFTAPEATVEDMIAFDLKFNEENGHPFGPQEEAERLLRAWLPTLKRWRK